MKPVRVGIIGTSWWADAMYLPALKNHPRARMEAVAGRNLETTRKFASRWDIPRHYEDADELIEKAAEVDRRFNAIASTVGVALKSAIVSAADSLAEFIDGFRDFQNQRSSTLEASQAEIGLRRLELL